MNRISAPLRRHLAALRAMVVFTVILGIAYPLLVTGIAQLTMKAKANGSLIKNAKGQVVGSSLLCQVYVDGKGNALPEYFQSRPSQASSSNDPNIPGCDYQYSGGSNLGTSSSVLKGRISGLIDSYSKAYNVDPAKVPQDAVTSSGSGMDPGISVANADIQAPFVAKARNLDPKVVADLVKKNTTGRDLGFLGQEVVNTTTLNLDLDKAAPVAAES
jgi:K+-transporting ATPase ATPase C chain